MNIQSMVTKILSAPDGGTLRTDSNNPLPLSGYFVGNGRKGFICHTDAVDHAFIFNALVWMEGLPEAPRFVGWWTDEDQFYIEPSDWAASYSEAMALARQRGELAFFDISSQSDIRLDRAA